MEVLSDLILALLDLLHQEGLAEELLSQIRRFQSSIQAIQQRPALLVYLNEISLTTTLMSSHKNRSNRLQRWQITSKTSTIQVREAHPIGVPSKPLLIESTP